MLIEETVIAGTRTNGALITHHPWSTLCSAELTLQHGGTDEATIGPFTLMAQSKSETAVRSLLSSHLTPIREIRGMVIR